MRLVVITQPTPTAEEANQINEMMAADSEFILHLRHPNASADEYRQILENIHPDYLPRVTLADHFELSYIYKVGGVHLSSRHSNYKGERKVRQSKSCHSLEEVQQNKMLDYVYLSPIFDSISKQGYHSAFTAEQLQAAKEQGIINKDVIALGGITLENIPTVATYGFGGVAILGYVWKDFSIERFKKICETVKKY